MNTFVPSFAQETTTTDNIATTINSEVIENKVETATTVEGEKETKKRFTTEDFKFVKENCAKMTVTQMAESRDLTPIQIKRIIAKAIEILNKSFEEGKLTEIQKNKGLAQFTPIAEERKRGRKKTEKPSITSMMDDFVASLLD